MSRANSNEETYNQGQDVNDSLRQGRRRSNSLVTELIYSDQEGSNPDVTLSTASPLTRVQLLRMGSYGDILGELICCSFPILTFRAKNYQLNKDYQEGDQNLLHHQSYY